MRDTINNKLTLKISVLAVILILITSFIIFIYYIDNKNEETEEEETIKPKTYDDSICAKESYQGLIFEVSRIHKKGIEKEFRKIGDSWKQKPNYYFIVNADDETWIGKSIQTWDTGYIAWHQVKTVENGTSKSTCTFKIMETTNKLFKTVELEIESFTVTYDYRTGRWDGDDYFNDSDGYGYFNGEKYEIWFTIYFFDNDGDQIPYWTEINILQTNPYVDDTKLDPDNDGIPTSWEWKWGYNPYIWDNHTYLDPDKDGIENIEEYQMQKWLSNPYRKDIYLEVDFMEKGAWYEVEHILWKESQWMVMDKFSEHDITLHIDDGWPGDPTNGGGEYLPFNPHTIWFSDGIASEYYKYHFPDERKGIFRYVFIQSGKIGWNSAPGLSYHPDTITLPSNRQWYAKTMYLPAITPKLMRLTQAVGLIHEMGHSLGINSRICAGCDNSSQVGRNELPPIQKLKVKIDAIKYWETYESVMNYNKFGKYVMDYSDGTHGIRDFDEWGYIDLTYFEKQPDYVFGFED